MLLEKELEKKEVQEGLIGACDVIDVIIAILRGSRNLKDAKECLMTGNTANVKFRSPGFEEDAKSSTLQSARRPRSWKCGFISSSAWRSWLYRRRIKQQKGSGATAISCPARKTWMRSSGGSGPDPGGVLCGAEDRDRDGEEIVFQEEKEAAREMIFAMGTGSAANTEKTVYERNPETVQAEHVETPVPVMTDDRICFFTDTGSMYQVKAADVPAGKLKDKGVPLDNISRFEGAKRRILCRPCPRQSFLERSSVCTRAAMLKIVPGEGVPHGQPHGSRHKRLP